MREHIPSSDFSRRLSFMASGAVLGRGAAFLLMKDPAEIQGIIIPDDTCNLIDGIGCIFQQYLCIGHP